MWGGGEGPHLHAGFVYGLALVCEQGHFIFRDAGRTILCFMAPQSTQCLLQVRTHTACTPELSCCVWLRFLLTLLSRLEALGSRFSRASPEVHCQWRRRATLDPGWSRSWCHCGIYEPNPSTNPTQPIPRPTQPITSKKLSASIIPSSSLGIFTWLLLPTPWVEGRVPRGWEP